MGCGTGGCGAGAYGGTGGSGAYGGVVHVMARELAQARGEGSYLTDAADGIRAEVRERGLAPAGGTGAAPDRSGIVAVVVLLLFLAAMGAAVAAHLAGYDAAPGGTSAEDDD